MLRTTSTNSVNKTSISDITDRNFKNTTCARINPGTVKGRKIYLSLMIILPFILIIALIIENSYIMFNVIKEHRVSNNVEKEIKVTVEINDLIRCLQEERIYFALYLMNIHNSSNYLIVQFSNTDKKIEEIRKNVKTTLFLDSDEIIMTYLNNISSVRNSIMDYHKLNNQNKCSTNCSYEYDEVSRNDPLNPIRWYQSLNQHLLNKLSNTIRDSSSSANLWGLLIPYRNLLYAIENTNVAALYGIWYYGFGVLSAYNRAQYIHYITLAREYISSTELFSVDIGFKHKEFVDAYPEYFNSIFNKRSDIYLNDSRSPDLKKTNEFYQDIEKYLTELHRYQDILSVSIREYVQMTKRKSFHTQLVMLCILMLVLAISPIIIILVHRTTKTIQMFATSIVHRTIQLRIEKKKSDKLLCQMLPKSVITQLRLQKKVAAENFDCVTIYFSDIIDFTRLSTLSSPMEIVNMLNGLYTLFDSCIKKYDVYKVETIGDSYMVVSGLPQRNGNKHAGEIATMSLDLLLSIQKFIVPHRPGEKLEVRVGLNTGPCVAGVVGTTMPRYCLFGDTINTASRMESTGEAMKIHISDDTRLALQELGGYCVEYRGTMDVKGKGMMKTYWLIGKEDGLPKIPDIIPENLFIPEFLHMITSDTDF